MKTSTITNAKNKLSALIDIVRHGDSVLIMDRGRPVARLEPAASPGKNEMDGRIQRLERHGMLRAPDKAMDLHSLSAIVSKPKEGGDILKALLADREEGR